MNHPAINLLPTLCNKRQHPVERNSFSTNRRGRLAAAASFPLPVRYFDRGHSRRSKENEIIMESIKTGGREGGDRIGLLGMFGWWTAAHGIAGAAFKLGTSNRTP
jgi:hypothetical protein